MINSHLLVNLIYGKLDARIVSFGLEALARIVPSAKQECVLPIVD